MTQNKKVTIHMIAEHAGVSISTVSRVINDTAGVSPKKKRAVHDAVAQLGYRPNLLAQGLAGGRSKTIGVLAQHISSPHYAHTLLGIFQGFNGTDYTVFFTEGLFDPVTEKRMIDDLRNRNVGGLIALVGSTKNSDLIDLSQELPLIIVGRNVPELAGHCLYLDQYAAAYEITSHLIEMGHRRIAHIVGIPEHQDAIDRKRAYIAALKAADIAFDPDLVVQGDFIERSGLMAVEVLLSRGTPFTAVFAANDQMAAGARLALYRRGIRVPEDVSIVGFDDVSWSPYLTPPLTTIRQPANEMGRAAAEMMLALLTGQPTASRRFPGDLIVRESVIRIL